MSQFRRAALPTITLVGVVVVQGVLSAWQLVGELTAPRPAAPGTHEARLAAAFAPFPELFDGLRTHVPPGAAIVHVPRPGVAAPVAALFNLLWPRRYVDLALATELWADPNDRPLFVLDLDPRGDEGWQLGCTKVADLGRARLWRYDGRPR